MISAEHRWVIWVSVIALVLANLPIALAFLTAPSGTVYTGIDSTAPGDVNVYLSYLEQARQGHLVFRDLFTSEPQRPMIFNSFWLGLGLLGSLLRLEPLAVYFLSRIVLGAVLLILLYGLASKVFQDVRLRHIAFVLAVFASGIGAWAAPIIDAWFHGNIPGPGWPMDLWVSEAFTFLSLHHSPHFLAATILILLTVWWLMRVVENRGLKSALYAGVGMLALFSFHPFHVVSLAYITIGFLMVVLLRSKRDFVRVFMSYGLTWLIASPAIVYQVWLILHDPLASGRAQQNILPTSWPGIAGLSYGFLLVGAIGGAVLLWRQKTLRSQLLVVWAAAHLLAIYAPVFFNRRLTQGLNVVLALLTAAAIAFLWERRPNRFLRRSFYYYLVPIVGLVMLSMSNLWVFAQDLSYLVGAQGRQPQFYFFLNRGYAHAFRWLRERGDDGSVVLSHPVTGNFIPGWSGRRVVIGHNVETLKFEEKRPNVERFFSTTESDEQRRNFLQSTRTTHVIVGPWERMIGGFDARGVGYLQPVFTEDGVTIFRVVL